MQHADYDNPATEVVPGLYVRDLRENLDMLFSDMEAEILTKTSAPALAEILDKAAKTKQLSTPNHERIAEEFRKIQFRYFIAAFVAGYKVGVQK